MSAMPAATETDRAVEAFRAGTKALPGAKRFTDAELETAFTDIVDWVENGNKPEGDAVTNPALVADPDFGCNFTDGSHFFGTPCP